jgi:hypothetical protein
MVTIMQIKMLVLVLGVVMTAAACGGMGSGNSGGSHPNHAVSGGSHPNHATSGPSSASTTTGSTAIPQNGGGDGDGDNSGGPSDGDGDI